MTELVTDNALDGDLDALREIERRLDQGQIDASEVADAYERADAILQAHEAVVSLISRGP